MEKLRKIGDGIGFAWGVLLILVFAGYLWAFRRIE